MTCGPDAIFDTGLGNVAQARDHPPWAQVPCGFANHMPEAGEHGMSSFIHLKRAPGDPVRSHGALTGPLPGVIRANGRPRAEDRLSRRRA